MSEEPTQTSASNPEVRPRTDDELNLIGDALAIALGCKEEHQIHRRHDEIRARLERLGVPYRERRVWITVWGTKTGLGIFLMVQRWIDATTDTGIPAALIADEIKSR